jgi:hypothetical protein
MNQESNLVMLGLSPGIYVFQAGHDQGGRGPFADSAFARRANHFRLFAARALPLLQIASEIRSRLKSKFSCHSNMFRAFKPSPQYNNMIAEYQKL